jgi:integrase
VIWNAVPVGDYGDLVRLLMLTGARRQELGDLRWSECDLAERLIRLPASRVKNKRPHEIPLSEMAIDILEVRHEARQARHNNNSAGVRHSLPGPFSVNANPEVRSRSGRAEGNGNAAGGATGGAVFGLRGRGFSAWGDGKLRLDRRLRASHLGSCTIFDEASLVGWLAWASTSRL